MENLQDDKLKQEVKIRQIKQKFLSFFAYSVNWDTSLPISVLEITNLDFHFKKDGNIILQVTLGKPGLFIGKGGNTIDALRIYLSTPECDVDIRIIESNLWNTTEITHEQVFPLLEALNRIATWYTSVNEKDHVIAKIAQHTLDTYNKNFKYHAKENNVDKS